jgi:hypothetical protein
VNRIPRTDDLAALSFVTSEQGSFELRLQERSIGNGRILSDTVRSGAEFLDRITLKLAMIAQTDCRWVDDPTIRRFKELHQVL